MISSDSTNPTMLACESFDAILEHVRNCGLNFQIQVSPFSAIISLKKSLVKDKSGNLLLPPYRHGTRENTRELVDNNIELTKMHEKVVSDYEKACELVKYLEKTLNEVKVKHEEATNTNEEQLKSEIETLKDTLKNRNSEIGSLQAALKTSTNVSEKLNKKLSEYRANFEQDKARLLKEHDIEIKALKEDVDDLKKENTKLKDKCVIKDEELGEAFDQKVKLEEKLNSLLDVLYGCPECGLNNCECDYSVNKGDFQPEDRSFSQHCTTQSSPPPTPSTRLLPPPSSDSSSWTPPPTPPCISCGGINFGPSPNNLCFKCISPLRCKSPQNNISPSRTPPGTPPTIRLETVIIRNEDRGGLDITAADDQQQ